MNFARIMEADVGLTECAERNVVQFSAAVLWEGALRDHRVPKIAFGGYLVLWYR